MVTDTHRGVFLPHDGFPIGFNTEAGEQLSYEGLQRMVGGLIECVYPDIGGDHHHLSLWMDEEARYNLKPVNLWATALVLEGYGYNMLGDGVLMSTDATGDTVGLDELEWEWVKPRLVRAQPEWYMQMEILPVSETMNFEFSWEEVMQITLGKRASEMEE